MYIARHVEKPHKCGHPRVPLSASFLELGLPAGFHSPRLEDGAAPLVGIDGPLHARDFFHLRDPLCGHVDTGVIVRQTSLYFIEIFEKELRKDGASPQYSSRDGI